MSHIKVSIFLLILTLGFFSPSAQAQNPFPTTSINVKGLGQYKGNYLTAFYGAGSVSGMALSADHLSMTVIYQKIADLPVLNDTITLPSQSIRWHGWSKPNVLLLVIHKDLGFTWVNSNPEGGQPAYESNIGLTSNTNYIAVSTVSTRLLNQNATGNLVNYDFNSQKPLTDSPVKDELQ